MPALAISPAATGEFRLDTGEFKHLRELLKEALEREESGGKEEGGDAAPGAGEGVYSPETPPQEAPSTSGAFRLVLRTRYLLLIGFLIVLLNWVNTNGENLLGFIVTDAARQAVAEAAPGTLTQGQFIGAFYSDFFVGVNVLTLVLQLFIVSRIIKYLGVHVAIMVLPVIALGAYGLVAAYPVLGYLRWAKTAENATDYSLQNTVRHTLFLPTTREQKYKAKQVIDSFFWRVGRKSMWRTVFCRE
jgi:AAA family ATP:ADP antiporter